MGAGGRSLAGGPVRPCEVVQLGCPIPPRRNIGGGGQRAYVRGHDREREECWGGILQREGDSSIAWVVAGRLYPLTLTLFGDKLVWLRRRDAQWLLDLDAE